MTHATAMRRGAELTLQIGEPITDRDDEARKAWAQASKDEREAWIERVWNEVMP